MYVDVYVNYQLFLSDFNGIWIFVDSFSKKNTQISNLKKVRREGAEMLRVDRQYDKANCRFSQFYERA